ncbi:hypothetical protein [Schaalia sp. ZJ1691]|uniref:hypothetical protein n=1 Tax=Schaalia sp. ZJ1691 TaxID=2709404 RepID=UPI0013EA77FC|nr:hypothetical protein [Schaalia sp. ZJ1691]
MGTRTDATFSTNARLYLAAALRGGIVLLVSLNLPLALSQARFSEPGMTTWLSHSCGRGSGTGLVSSCSSSSPKLRAHRQGNVAGQGALWNTKELR